MQNIVTANASKIAVKVGETWLYPAMMEDGEFTDSPNSVDINAKGSTITYARVTGHTYTGSGTFVRVLEDAGQEALIEASEGKIGDDCVMEIGFEFADGTYRKGLFNVAVTNSGFSGAALDLAKLEVQFTFADGELTKGTGKLVTE